MLYLLSGSLLETCFPASAATGKKSVSLPKKSDSSSTQPEKLKNEDTKEDSNGDGVGERDVQITEEILDGNVIDTEMAEAPLETDENKIGEENEKEETGLSTDITQTGPGKRKLQIQGKWRGVDPVIFYKDDSVVSRIMEFYGIMESFPFKGHLITRNNDMNHVKRIYYVSSSVKEVLELNFLAGQQLKIASVGLKMFVSHLYVSIVWPFSVLLI